MNNKYKLVFMDKENKDHLRICYKWQIAEGEKQNMCCYPVDSKQTQEYSEENFAKFYNNIKPKIGKEFMYVFLLETTSEKYLGYATYSEFNPRNGSIELSYYFPKEHRKQGFGKILIKMFLDVMFNFERMNLNKIWAETYEGNIGSVKLLERNGFKLDGRNREHYWFDDGKERYDQLIYSILRSEWENELN